MTIEIAKGHSIGFQSDGRAIVTSEDAATWWESLSLIERTHLWQECLAYGHLNGPDTIHAFRNPS